MHEARTKQGKASEGRRLTQRGGGGERRPQALSLLVLNMVAVPLAAGTPVRRRVG